MPKYFVRFVQMHESFRVAELQALATLVGVKLEVLKYDEDVRQTSSSYLPFSCGLLDHTLNVF
jgi:tRNA G10  N-methylase Trm11